MKTIADIEITGPFDVYAVNTGHYIHMWYDRTAPGDIAPDLAMLPVLGVRYTRSDTATIMTIETEV